MILLYFIQDKRNDFAYPENQLIYSDKTILEQMMKRLSDGFTTLHDNENYEISSLQVNDKCKCSDYMQTTMFLINTNDLNNIRLVGSDNFIGIHNKVNLPIDVDIETYTNGRYQLMSEEYFNENYVIEMKRP